LNVFCRIRIVLRLDLALSDSEFRSIIAELLCLEEVEERNKLRELEVSQKPEVDFEILAESLFLSADEQPFSFSEAGLSFSTTEVEPC